MITIIDNIAPPAPFFTRKPKPTTFKTELDEKRYWEKEKQRWIEGYNSDINGMLYFYATQIWLKDRNTGELYYPTVRDADVFIFNELKRSMDEGESPFIIKGRGVGLSSIGMNLPYYFFRAYPNSTCIATSRDKKTLALLFTEKTMVAYDEMDEFIKPDLINKNQTAGESFLATGYNYLDVRGNVRYSQNKLFCRDTQESDKAATNFSGAGAIYGFADEAPLMVRFSKFFDSARECFIDHSKNRMVGLLLNGGTVEDTIKTEDVQRIQEVWENSKALRIRPIFIPATYGKHMTNGHSDHKRAEEEILQRREELKNLPDKLKAYIKNNPLTIDEIFDFAKGNSRWEEYTIERINIQAKHLQSNPAPIHKYKLTEFNGIVEAHPHNEGWLEMLERPKENVKYVLGLDATQSTDTTSGSERKSKLSFYVMKGVDPQSDIQFAPVAKIVARPKDFDDIFNKCMLTLKYYNKFGLAKVTGEGNATGNVFAEKALKNPDTKKCVLKKRDLKAKGYVDTDKPFFYRNDDVKDWQYLTANTYFKKYVENVKFLSLLQDCQKPDSDNTDELDAFLACLYGWGTGDLLGEPQKKKSPKKILIIVGWKNNAPIYEERELN